MKLIDGDALKEAVSKHPLIDFTDGDIFELIDNAPTIDNAYQEGHIDGMLQAEKLYARPQGEWTDLSTDERHVGWIACSVCGQEPPNESNLRTDFCPNCGAKMKGGAE